MAAPKKERPAKKKPAAAPLAPVVSAAPAEGGCTESLPGSCETIVSSLTDAAVITENKWEKGGAKIIYPNAAFCRLTGYSAAELVGKNTRVLHGAKTDITLLRHGRRENTLANESKGEGFLARKDGTPFFAQWNFSELNCGDAKCFVAIYRDQSEFKRLRDALIQTQKLGAVGLLASGVAHDFNNLLSVINGYCEIMSAKIAGVPAARKDLQEIHRAGLKASAIARQILEFSRRKETEVKVINFNTLIREVAEIIRRIAGEDITVELRLASDLGNARMDATHFQQALLNLCFNARDAMPTGGKLTIRTSNCRVAGPADRRVPEMQDGNYTVMRVQDTGTGMTPEVLGNIFQPFYSTKAHGTGLGLSMVHRILGENDGYITVQSELNRGTVFEIFVPETAEPAQTLVTKLSHLPTIRGTESILVVEPDKVLRQMISGILSADGYRVADFGTAEAALAFVEKSTEMQHLVLTHCSTKTGKDLVRKLQARNRGLRIVSTSAESPRDALPELSPRTLAHLPKPFALSTLVQTVRAVLDARP